MADTLPPRLTFKERNRTLDYRVRTSEVFPRIRDAEIGMALEEAAFTQRIDAKILKRKTQRHAGRTTVGHSPSQRALPKAAKAEVVAKEYFSSHVLNKDPACSKYMPFDVVHFPKLFNPNEATHRPESLDFVWMLGFQHMASTASHLTVTGKEKGQMVV